MESRIIAITDLFKRKKRERIGAHRNVKLYKKRGSLCKRDIETHKLIAQFFSILSFQLFSDFKVEFSNK